jgi:hypothetical protein
LAVGTFGGCAVVGAAEGEEEVEVEGAEGAADGVAARLAPRLVDVSSRESALPEVPPCWVFPLDGEPTA